MKREFRIACLEGNFLNACEKGDIQTVIDCIKDGADVTANDNSAIRSVSRNGHLSIVRLLIDHGADISDGNNYAIQVASENGHRLLIEHGADVSANDNSAIRHASLNGHTSVVDVLLEHESVSLDNETLKYLFSLNNEEIDLILAKHSYLRRGISSILV